MKYIEFTDKQIKSNNIRTIKNGLFSNLNKEQINELISKYFRDENGNLYCAYSGEIIKNKKDLALEHIIPVNRNGSSVIFNVCPALTSINISKHDNELLSWWKEQDFYSVDRLRNLTMYVLEAYNTFFNDETVIANDLEDINENIEELKQEEYNKAKRTKEQHLQQIDYRSFLNSLIYELEQNNITLENIDKESKRNRNYREIYDVIMSDNYFENFKETEKYQRIIFKHLKTLAKERKYVIASNIDYKEIYEHLEQQLNKNNTKEEHKEAMVEYEIQKRMIYLTRIVARELSSPDIAVLETIIDMPELLYKEIPYPKEYLEKIKDNLPMNKYIKYQYLVEFYEKNNRWPTQKEKYKGENIGSFLGSLKQGYTKLTEKEVRELQLLDPNVFGNPTEVRKNNTFDLLIEFYEQNNRWPTQKEKYKGENIGSFYSRIKSNGVKITEEQEMKLLELDPNVFKDPRKIDTKRRLEILIKFYKENNRWPQTSGEIYDGENIGRFLMDLKTEKTTLTEEQQAELLELDSNVFKNPKKIEVDRKFDILIEYAKNKKDQGDKYIWPTRKEEYKDIRIGAFLDKIKQRPNMINETQKNIMLELDPSVFENPRKMEVNRKFNLLLEFYEENNRWPKSDEKDKTGENIGNFLHGIRQNNINLSEDQREQLLKKDPHIFEDLVRLKVNTKFQELLEFYKENDRRPRRVQNKKEDLSEQEKMLSYFLESIKQGNTYLTEDQKQQLLKLDPALIIKEKQKIKEIKNLKITEQSNTEKQTGGRHVA